MTDPALNVAATRDKATEIADPFAPIFADVDSGGDRKFGFDSGTADRETLVAACRRARVKFAPTPELDEAVLAHAIAFASRFHLLGLIPTREQEQHIQDLAWGRAVCLFAGLGYTYHKPIFEYLHTLTPWCPVDPEETAAEWEKRWRAAHETSGWPVGLLLMSWRELREAAGFTEDPEVVDWHGALATAHLLKHLRRDDRKDEMRLIALYGGEVHEMKAITDASLLVGKDRQVWLAHRLGAKALTGGNASPLDCALFRQLTQVPPTALIRRRPLADLPPQVFQSPGAHLVPDVSELNGYFQHGLTLRGVKIANAGKVIDYESWPGSADDVLGYAWPLTPAPEHRAEDDLRWREAMPDSYDAAAWPSDVLADYFPNVRWLSKAHKYLFDAVLCAQVCRDKVPRLSNEFPAICFLPADATPEGSTKQGKSTLATAVLKALAPAALYAQRTGNDNISIRALNWEIADNGTAGFDEFRLSGSPMSPMHRDRLQALCTGQAVDMPMVRENRGGTYRLRAGLVIGAKTFDLPDDLQNRFLIYWMDRLPAKAWKDQGKFFRAQNGALACLLRLAALGVAENGNIAEWLNDQEVDSAENALRYPMHRLLAGALLAGKEGCDRAEGLAQVDATVAQMGVALAQHTVQAEDSHLAAILDEGNAISKLSLEAVVDDLDEDALRGLCFALRGAAKTEIGWVRPTSLLNQRAYLIHRLTNNTEPLAKQLACILPQAFQNKSDRVIVRAFMSALRVRFSNAAEDGSIPLPGAHGIAGWRMQRKTDESAGADYIRLYNDNPAHSTNKSPRAKSPVA